MVIGDGMVMKFGNEELFYFIRCLFLTQASICLGDIARVFPQRSTN